MFVPGAREARHHTRVKDNALPFSQEQHCDFFAVINAMIGGCNGGTSDTDRNAFE